MQVVQTLNPKTNLWPFESLHVADFQLDLAQAYRIIIRCPIKSDFSRTYMMGIISDAN